MEEMKKTCCVTGHREIPSIVRARVEERLREEILQAIEAGYTHFISGFADGTDLIFARLICELKKEYGLTLEAALPLAQWRYRTDPEFSALLKSCDKVIVCSEKWRRQCFYMRNRYMVDHAQRVIGVYDGRSRGGTAMTLRYAECLRREIRIIPFVEV